MMLNFSNQPERLSNALRQINATLRHLYLDNNSIQSMTELPVMNYLLILSLNNNFIQNFDGLQNFAGLQSIFLNSNKISSFVNCCQHSTLQNISLNNNQFSRIITENMLLIVSSIFPNIKIINSCSVSIQKDLPIELNVLNFLLTKGIEEQVFCDQITVRIGARHEQIEAIGCILRTSDYIKNNSSISIFACKFGKQFLNVSKQSYELIQQYHSSGYIILHVIDVVDQKPISHINGKIYLGQTITIYGKQVAIHQRVMQVKQQQLINTCSFQEPFFVIWNQNNINILTTKSLLQFLSHKEFQHVAIYCDNFMIFDGFADEYQLSEEYFRNKQLTFKLFDEHKKVISSCSSPLIQSQISQVDIPFTYHGDYTEDSILKICTSLDTVQFHGLSSKTIVQILTKYRVSFQQLVMLLSNSIETTFTTTFNKVIVYNQLYFQEVIIFEILSYGQSINIPSHSFGKLIISVINNRILVLPRAIQRHIQLFNQQNEFLYITLCDDRLMIQYSGISLNRHCNLIVRYTQLNKIISQKPIDLSILNKLMTKQQFYVLSEIDLNQISSFSIEIHGILANQQHFSIQSNTVDTEQTNQQLRSFDANTCIQIANQKDNLIIFDINISQILTQFFSLQTETDLLAQYNPDLLNVFQKIRASKDMSQFAHLDEQLIIYDANYHRYVGHEIVSYDIKILNVYGVLEIKQLIYIDIPIIVKDTVNFGILQQKNNAHVSTSANLALSFDHSCLDKYLNMNNYNFLSVNNQKFELGENEVNTQLYVFAIQKNKLDLIKLNGNPIPLSFISQIYINKLTQKDEYFYRQIKLILPQAVHSLIEINCFPDIQVKFRDDNVIEMSFESYIEEVVLRIVDAKHKSCFQLVLPSFTTGQNIQQFRKQSSQKVLNPQQSSKAFLLYEHDPKKCKIQYNQNKKSSLLIVEWKIKPY